MTDTCETKRRKIDTTNSSEDDSIETEDSLDSWDSDMLSNDGAHQPCVICCCPDDGFENILFCTPAPKLVKCVRCEEEVCDDCINIHIPRYETHMSWEHLKILFIARAKEYNSMLYKGRLSLEIFQYILNYCLVWVEEKNVCFNCWRKCEREQNVKKNALC